MAFFMEFLTIFLSVYLVSLSVYFVTGFLLAKANARFPERRIQLGRDGNNRSTAEIFSSLKALAISALLLSIGYFAQTQGWVLFEPISLSWWSFLGFFAVIFLLFDAWFYWGHRLLHVRRFYRWHLTHHRSVTPSAWSNDSSAVMDTVIEHGFYLLVWFFLPVPALSVFALRLFDQVSGMIGHCGFEYFAGKTTRKPYPFLCTTFHDLHHSQFHYNFGNFLSVWDRLMGTLHPKYDAIVEQIEKTGSIPDVAFFRVERPSS